MIPALLLCLALPLAADQEWYVDARRGSDADGQGTLEAPFRSVTKALEGAEAGAVLHLAYGEYGATTGEVFPLRVPAGVTLRGSGPAATVLKGAEGTGVLVRCLPGEDPVRLESLGLSGGGRGVVLEAQPDRTVTTFLVDVHFQGLQTALDLVSPDQSDNPVPGIYADLTRCRVRDGDRGVVLRGAGRMVLNGTELDLRGLRRGVDLDARTDGHGTHHSIYLQDSTFQDCTESGLHREGPDGAAEDSSGLILVGCRFLDNDNGIYLALPGGDVAFHLADSVFRGNRSFGLRAAGGLEDPRGQAMVEHCDFDWNGVALHLTGMGLPWSVQRSRISGSVGNGILLGTFHGQDSRIHIRDTVIDHNGGAGIFLIADVDKLAIEVEHCTLVRNGGGGIRRKDRHGGQTSLRVERSILWDNRMDGAPNDCVNLVTEDLHGCLVSDGQWLEAGANFQADPLFVDAGGRDYRLALGSPCRLEGGGEGVMDSLIQDRNGCVRDPAKPVVGAFCCPPPHR